MKKIVSSLVIGLALLSNFSYADFADAMEIINITAEVEGRSEAIAITAISKYSQGDINKLRKNKSEAEAFILSSCTDLANRMKAKYSHKKDIYSYTKSTCLTYANSQLNNALN